MVSLPLITAVLIWFSSLQFYSCVVYDDLECSPEMLDHGVLAVGYCVEGTSRHRVLDREELLELLLGQDSYVKMARNMRNQYHIASSASIPLV